MIHITIARRYAKALLAIGKEDQKVSEYNDQLKEFARLLQEIPELAETLSNPLYPLDTRKKILQGVLDKTDLSPVVKNFITLLLDKKRIRYFEDIAAYYQKMVDDFLNISSATIISASELPEKVVEDIKKAIEKMTKKKVRLQTEVDPSIIGGVITKVGDMNFDGSVRTQLLSLKETLKRGE